MPQGGWFPSEFKAGWKNVALVFLEQDISGRGEGCQPCIETHTTQLLASTYEPTYNPRRITLASLLDRLLINRFTRSRSDNATERLHRKEGGGRKIT